MPRAGDGSFSNVPGTTVTASTTILSAWANGFTADVAATFNTEWPIALLPTITVAKGGTGATTVIGAVDNLFTASSNIASAATTDLSTATGLYVAISGTTTITAFGTEAAGVIRILKFLGILTLTYNATSVILPGSANITTAAGDIAVFVSEGSGNWRCITYQRVATVPVRSQAWEHISTSTPAAAGTATFTDLSAYRFLRATVYLTLSVDNEILYIQTSVGGTFATAGTDYNNQVINGFSTTLATANADTFGLRVGDAVGNAANEAISSTVYIFELNQAKQAHHTADTFQLNGSAVPIRSAVGGRRLNTSARDGIRFLPGSGNITGIVVLEGIRG